MNSRGPEATARDTVFERRGDPDAPDAPIKATGHAVKPSLRRTTMITRSNHVRAVDIGHVQAALGVVCSAAVID